MFYIIAFCLRKSQIQDDCLFHVLNNFCYLAIELELEIYLSGCGWAHVCVRVSSLVILLFSAIYFRPYQLLWVDAKYTVQSLLLANVVHIHYSPPFCSCKSYQTQGLVGHTNTNAQRRRLSRSRPTYSVTSRMIFLKNVQGFSHRKLYVWIVYSVKHFSLSSRHFSSFFVSFFPIFFLVSICRCYNAHITTIDC